MIKTPMPVGVFPDKIGKIVVIHVFQKDSDGQLKLDTLVRHVGVLSFYVFDGVYEEFVFGLTGMPEAISVNLKTEHVEFYEGNPLQ